MMTFCMIFGLLAGIKLARMAAKRMEENIMKERKIELQAIEHYGVPAQVSKAIEEASELIRALCRFQQRGMNCSDDEIYNIREDTQIGEIKRRKLERLRKRMECSNE